MVDGLNSIPGVSCQPAEGAMYAFPSVELPARAVAHDDLGDIGPHFAHGLKTFMQ